MASPVQVTIIRDKNGKWGADPPTACIDRDNQQLQWTIGVEGYSWPTNGDGIVPKTSHLGSGVSPWPGNKPQQKGDTYIADAEDPLPHGSQRKKYHYIVTLVETPTNEFLVLAPSEDLEEMVQKYGKDRVVRFDPDIQNDPLP